MAQSIRTLHSNFPHAVIHISIVTIGHATTKGYS